MLLASRLPACDPLRPFAHHLLAVVILAVVSCCKCCCYGREASLLVKQEASNMPMASHMIVSCAAGIQQVSQFSKALVPTLPARCHPVLSKSTQLHTDSLLIASTKAVQLTVLKLSACYFPKPCCVLVITCLPNRSISERSFPLLRLVQCSSSRFTRSPCLFL